MRILLDTHILYWWFYDKKQLSDAAVSMVRDADDVFVSSASVWEMAIKVRIGKMKVDIDRVIQQIHAARFEQLPILYKHAQPVARLPLHHDDHFDRLLIAQAMSEPLHFLTADKRLRPYTELVVCV